jgi:hypothetical protein
LDKLATTRNEIVHAVYRPVYLPNGKIVIRKSVFRSARKTLNAETIAQTGELQHHVRFLKDAQLWLNLSGWGIPKASYIRGTRMVLEGWPA